MHQTVCVWFVGVPSNDWDSFHHQDKPLKYHVVCYYSTDVPKLIFTVKSPSYQQTSDTTINLMWPLTFDMYSNPSTHVRLHLAVEAGGAEGRVGRQAFVPLAGPWNWSRLHEAALELTDASVMAHDLSLGLFHILRDRESERKTSRQRKYTRKIERKKTRWHRKRIKWYKKKWHKKRKK